MIDFQELVVEELWRLKHVSSDKPPSIQAHAAMKLLQKSSSQLTLLESTLDSILPRLIDDTLEERLTDIFSDSVKNKFRTLLDNVIQENLPWLNQKIRRSLQTEMPDIIDNSL
ncbi:hypothetical protein Tco_0787826 [Tanacetum coccineum]